eukprot:6214801-Pleurochrysis_carterae.AAC.3
MEGDGDEAAEGMGQAAEFACFRLVLSNGGGHGGKERIEKHRLEIRAAPIRRNRQRNVKELESELSKHKRALTALANDFATKVNTEVAKRERAAQRDRDSHAYSRIARLEAEMEQLRRQAAQGRFVRSTREECENLRAELASRDDSILKLKREAAAAETRAATSARRLTDAERTTKQFTTQVKEQAAELKELRHAVESFKEDKAHKLARMAALEEQCSYAAARIATVQAEADRSAANIDKIEANCEEALEKLQDKYTKATDELKMAKALIGELQAQLAARIRENAAPKAHTDEEFDMLSIAGKRTARHRDVEFALAFLSQRTWRAADWVIIVEKQGWLEDFFDSKQCWRLRMDWAHELFATCTSLHWGSKLGLYLTLTEHMPTRQIRRISQACY